MFTSIILLFNFNVDLYHLSIFKKINMFITNLPLEENYINYSHEPI